MKRLLALLPIVFFTVLAGFFLYGLERDNKDVLHSPLIGKPVPPTTLADPDGRAGGISARNFADGKPKLVNFFASWCPPCHAEHPHLMALQKAGVEIYGIAVKDKPQNIKLFLAHKGNPYTQIGADGNGRAAIDWGVYGYPESYLIDRKGIIRYKHVGDIRAEHVPHLLHRWQKLEAER